jgi:DNA mismatch repair protein MutS
VDLGRGALTRHFGTRDLHGFGCNDMTAGLGAAAAVLHFACATQRQSLEFIDALSTVRVADTVALDAVTRRNLEIDQRFDGSRADTLFGVMNSTATAMGARLLRVWLNAPSRNRDVVQARQEAIGVLKDTDADETFAASLADVGDLERVLTRVALKSAAPRDLARLRTALAALPGIRSALAALDSTRLESLHAACVDFDTPTSLLERAIVAEPPATLRDGGVIADGYDTELDALRRLSENAGLWLTDLERRERERTGIATLKVGYNRVHGYYIETSRASANGVPADYQRRQTLKHAERYVTPELKEFEDEILTSHARALTAERRLYEALLEALVPELPALRRCAAALAELDVLTALAERARRLDLVAPELTDAAGFEIDGGRHPVVEHVQQAPFIANDLRFDESRRMLVITGPNMGGKSTYMRQVALIVLLAHTGSFVPARAARIGPVDRIFTRIGAADDLAAGRSTFMVEMTEAANILHNATPQSLVLLDEIGRGTSTYDGLALAWACASYLAQTLRAFTLFATHYFELTALAERHPGVANVHLAATEHKGEIVFLHSVRDGPASQSYGIQVARLAGVPTAVLERARRKLEELERAAAAAAARAQGDLFQPPPPPPPAAATELLDELAAVDPDALTPRDAQALLYDWVQRARDAVCDDPPPHA